MIETNQSVNQTTHRIPTLVFIYFLTNVKINSNMSLKIFMNSLILIESPSNLSIFFFCWLVKLFDLQNIETWEIWLVCT